MTNLLYVLDSSNGVSDRSFDFFKDFVRKDLQSKTLSENSVKAGVLVYGSSSALQIGPTYQKPLLKVYTF